MTRCCLCKWDNEPDCKCDCHLPLPEPTILAPYAVDPLANIPERTWINVRGRKEHEAILKDPEKCEKLGLDVYYERMVYLKRWGGWLDE